MILRKTAAELVQATGVDLMATLCRSLGIAPPCAAPRLGKTVEGWDAVAPSLRRIARALWVRFDPVIGADAFLLRIGDDAVAVARRDQTLECGAVRSGDVLWLRRGYPARRIGCIFIDDEALLAWRCRHVDAAVR